MTTPTTQELVESIAKVAGSLLGGVFGKALLLMVLWGSFAPQVGVPTIGYGTALVGTLFVGVVSTRAPAKPKG